MEDMKQLMQNQFIQYASYVILDRAIPHIIDGLKPVQRRILHTLKAMHDGKLHKVANAVGQVMAYHPHGDAAIGGALVNIANKGFLLDRQGNFGNLFTGDSAAAVRYIETRLSTLANETMFNADLTEFVPAYDGRNQEPTVLPAKIPVLLMQGSEGIAVGMSTKILPHNFLELLEAQIAILEGEEFVLYPDFSTGGIMDISQYDKGRGKIKLRAKIEVKEAKTLNISEICHGTTTESLIRSIDEAAKKGKIKIDSIYDFTAEKVEIEVKLPRGHYAQDLIDALYAYTDCEVSISTQAIVIKDQLPLDTNVDDILRFNTESLKGYLKRELEIEQERLIDKKFQKTLEQLFIEKRLYKEIEDVASYEDIHDTIAKGLKKFHKKLSRIPEHEDRERLLNIPIRRISRFDLNKNLEDIQAIDDRLEQIGKDLKRMKAFTIKYLKSIIKKFGKSSTRKTKIQSIEQLDMKAIQTEQIKVGFDPKSGFIGTKVKGGTVFECSNFDKMLFLFKNGSYKIINIPEKEFAGAKESQILYVGVVKKDAVFSVVYTDSKTRQAYGKRFSIAKFLVGKVYQYVPENAKVEFITTEPDVKMLLKFVPKARQKVAASEFFLDDIAVKGVSSKGIRMATREVRKVAVIKSK